MEEHSVLCFAASTLDGITMVKKKLQISEGPLMSLNDLTKLTAQSYNFPGSKFH